MLPLDAFALSKVQPQLSAVTPLLSVFVVVGSFVHGQGQSVVGATIDETLVPDARIGGVSWRRVVTFKQVLVLNALLG